VAFALRLLPLCLAAALAGCGGNTVIYCTDPNSCGGGGPGGNPGDNGSPDMAMPSSGSHGDMAMPANRSPGDMAMARQQNPDLTYVPPPAGTVGPRGGTVSRLLFGVTGDTRPMNCDDVNGYPTQVISSIFGGMQAAGVQFALATGDHQYVCSGGYTNGVQQLQLYQQAMQALQGKIVFPVMGNHECSETSICSINGYSPGRFKAYVDTLLSPNWSQPYFSFDVQTDNGTARFVLAADTAWDATQSAWLSQTLSSAQASAKYIFVLRHYPMGTRFNDNTIDPTLAEEEGIINQYHYTMLITGHTHEYRHDSTRVVTMGLGGAPLTGNASYWGYLIIEQNAAGDLDVKVYDQASGNMTDGFTVSP
jgi:hypothetical protein